MVRRLPAPRDAEIGLPRHLRIAALRRLMRQQLLQLLRASGRRPASRSWRAHCPSFGSLSSTPPSLSSSTSHRRARGRLSLPTHSAGPLLCGGTHYGGGSSLLHRAWMDCSSKGRIRPAFTAPDHRRLFVVVFTSTLIFTVALVFIGTLAGVHPSDTASNTPGGNPVPYHGCTPWCSSLLPQYRGGLQQPGDGGSTRLRLNRAGACSTTSTSGRSLVPWPPDRSRGGQRSPRPPQLHLDRPCADREWRRGSPPPTLR
ncbi:unnamed protein product [Urochloa humidicola]